MSFSRPLRRTRRAGLFAATALLTLAAQVTPAALAPPEASAAASFTDDFNGPAGSAADAAKWNYETGDNSGNNHERQYYTAGAANAALDGQGHLVITARKENPGNYNCWYGRCEYTSARLNTSGRFSQAYGHFETRMKLPRGQGMWPAFWMLGGGNWPTDGEIDVMENIGKEPNTVHGTIHGPGYSGANGIGAAYNGPNFSDDFHTYAVDWSPNKLSWSVDGHVYQTRTPADLNGNRWVYDHNFFVIMNLAVGGDWPGNPDGSTQFPQQLVVDYVHVTTDSGTPPTGRTGTITGIGGKCVDVAGANTANTTPIQITDCNGNAAQNWTIGSDGTLRALGKCMDVTAASTADGAAVQLYDCNNTSAQQWVISSAHDIVNPSANKCLDATGNNSANGTRLQIWTCTGGTNQKWTTP
ncbi:family 16 glycosylhydrolase [Amycolatopsis sp. PS_44_ISF1]|uniref:family 16 glycosylhydrolase n=1 Tax=Amycolatopsis sp. PS_44_ISF1 TaxID=2974917 RepID=UPI0028DD9B63|nr:family 16 glycosylhydrolase [Amycolatopsis sp. PS_44_ISF1]MDT8911237.1 family 16 glycosylhydrolase [Amycolatopsis sp. PS_44_ISF1]